MNSRLRVLLIGRRFWPHGSNDSAGYLMQLASGLQRRGIDIEVLTPRYATAWTTEMDFCEIKVHRPLVAPRSDWSMNRYVRSLESWFNEHADSFDVLLVDSAREESIAAVECIKSLRSRSGQCRVVVRVGGYGDQSDLLWWKSSRWARRCAAVAKRADKVIAVNAMDERGLLSQGFSASMVTRIEEGFDSAIVRTPENRIESRRALAAINSDFHAPPNEPVAVCVTSMDRDSNVQILVESARHLVARYPDLHLWFIGDGRRRESIFHYLRGDGIRSSIAMPGSFGNMEDVYQAADVFVHTDDQGLQTSLPCALAAELPIVAADNPQTRSRLRSDPPNGQSVISATAPDQQDAPDQQEAPDQQDAPGQNRSQANVYNAEQVHWFQMPSPKTFRKAFRSAMDDLGGSQTQAINLKRNLVRERPFRATIDDYVNVLEQVRHQRSQSASLNLYAPSDSGTKNGESSAGIDTRLNIETNTEVDTLGPGKQFGSSFGTGI